MTGSRFLKEMLNYFTAATNKHEKYPLLGFLVQSLAFLSLVYLIILVAVEVQNINANGSTISLYEVGI